MVASPRVREAEMRFRRIEEDRINEGICDAYSGIPPRSCYPIYMFGYNLVKSGVRCNEGSFTAIPGTSSCLKDLRDKKDPLT